MGYHPLPPFRKYVQVSVLLSVFVDWLGSFCNSIYKSQGVHPVPVNLESVRDIKRSSHSTRPGGSSRSKRSRNTITT